MLAALTGEMVLGFVRRHKYVAMFSCLFFSGMGLPIPEEVTLIASGLAVGWGEALFLPASVACVLGILVSDCFLFAMGRYCGPWILKRRPFRWAFTPAREERVRRLFKRYGNVAVFIGRFLAVVRLGVLVWAGQQQMRWSRFLLIDVPAAVISGPVTILVGIYVARQFTDPHDALESARGLVRWGSWWLWVLLAAVISFLVIRWLWRARRASPGRGTRGDTGETAPLPSRSPSPREP